jgi:hypothetical protein
MSNVLTARQVAWALVNYGGFNGWPVVTFGAICVPESLRDSHAHNLNTHNPQSAAYLSYDDGLFQLNEFFWGDALRAHGIVEPGETLSMALMRIRRNVLGLRMIWDAVLFKTNGDQLAAYTHWNAYKNQLHLPFLAEAAEAARSIGVILR